LSSKVPAATPEAAAVETGGRRPPPELADAELADAYFHYQAKVDLFKPTADYREALGKEIQRRYAGEPSDQEFALSGAEAVIQVGMRKMERFIPSVLQLYKISKLKIGDFLGHCSVTLAAAETIPNGKTLIREERTGTRPLKAVPIPKDNIKEHAA